MWMPSPQENQAQELEEKATTVISIPGVAVGKEASHRVGVMGHAHQVKAALPALLLGGFSFPSSIQLSFQLLFGEIKGFGSRPVVANVFVCVLSLRKKEERSSFLRSIHSFYNPQAFAALQSFLPKSQCLPSSSRLWPSPLVSPALLPMPLLASLTATG